MPPSQAITTLIDQEIIKTLVKEHIKEEPCMQTCLWKCGDPEVVVEAYKGFLVACAEKNVSISHLVLAKAMGKIFTTRRKLRASKWPDPYIFDCRILDRKTQKEKSVPLAMHLIHEILKVIPSIPLHTYFLHGV